MDHKSQMEVVAMRRPSTTVSPNTCDRAYTGAGPAR